MQKIESILENESYEIIWDFEVQSDSSMTARGANVKSGEYTVLNFHNPVFRQKLLF